jgi:hypothetical protein
MKNADQPAYPDPLRGGEQSITNQSPHTEPSGLTKREYFAAMAMQGMCANPNMETMNIPMGAISIADELLRQLES